MEVLKKNYLSAENLASALNRSFYEGERFILKVGEVEVGLVPPEDIRILEEIENANTN